MPSIFGAGLGDIIREGTQAGLGFMAGREAKRERDDQREQELRRAMIQDALMRSQIVENQAQAARALSGPTRSFSDSEVLGLVLPFATDPEEGITDEQITQNVMSANPDVAEGKIRNALHTLRRRRASDERAEAAAERAGGGFDLRGATTTERRTLNAMKAVAEQMKRSGADETAIDAELQARHPDADEWLRMAALNAVFDEQGGLLERLLQLTLMNTVGEPGGS